MAPHTPGPWTVYDLMKSDVVGTLDGTRIARVYRSAVNPNHRADANLVAAAPDLYEALQSAIAWIALATARDPETTHPKAIENAQHDVQKALAAIAKAEGR